MASLLTCLLVLLPLPAHAGQWSLSVSGSTTTPSAPGSYTFVNSQVTGSTPSNPQMIQQHPYFTISNGGCGLTYLGSGVINLSVTATLTWVPSAQGDTSKPPPTVDVLETASASNNTFLSSPSNVSTDADDGLGVHDPVTHPAPGTGPPAPYSYGSQCSGSLLTHLTVPAGSLSVSLPQRSLSSTLSGAPASGSGTGMGLNYAVQLDARDITLSLGGALQDSSGNYDILVGQGCGAKLVGIPSYPSPGAQITYSWNVSGTTLQSWKVVADPNNQSHTAEVDGYGPATNATASWYWNDPKQPKQ